MKLQYKCKLCECEFNKRLDYNNHKKEVHGLIDEEIECSICGKKLKKLGIGYHTVKLHNLKLQEYYDKYIRKPGEGICPVCGKETTYVDITVGYLKYCSNKCSNNDIEVIEKKNSTCLKNNGYEHPYQSPIIRSKIQKNLKYDNINFDSGWEIQYYIWLKDHNINFIYQPNPIEYFIENKKHYYHPDFYLTDTNEYIEIKATRFLYKGVNNKWNSYSKEKLECIKNHAKILTEETKELKDVFKYITNKYKLNEGRKSFIKELKKGNIK